MMNSSAPQHSDIDSPPVTAEPAVMPRYSNETIHPLSAPTEPVIRQIVDYWESITTSSGLGSKARFSPGAIADLLPHICLIDIDVATSPPEFTIRLMGTNVVAGTDVEATGMNLTRADAVLAPRKIVRFMNTCLEERNPVFGTSDFDNSNGERLTYELCFLPMSSNDRDLDMLLAGLLARRASTNRPVEMFG